jgi:hypothetical protein
LNFDAQDTFQNLDNKVISDLVSELFNHVNSKETFNHISELLITSLSEYKKKFSSDTETEDNDYTLKKINRSEYINTEYNFNNSTSEYLSISNDIHSILSNCPDLTNTQKLDFCNNQRYFMKLYLKATLTKLNKT